MKLISLKKRKEILKNRVVIAIFFVNFFLIGANANLLAIAENGGKMPVYTDTNFTTDQRHFLYNDSSTVNMFIFTDIMHVAFVKQGFELYFSVGDVLIYLTGVSFFIYCSIVLVKDIRYLYLAFQEHMKNKSKPRRKRKK